MDGRALIAWEAALVIGAVFGFGIWQLWSLRRERRRNERGRERDARADEPG